MQWLTIFFVCRHRALWAWKSCLGALAWPCSNYFPKTKLPHVWKWESFWSKDAFNFRLYSFLCVLKNSLSYPRQFIRDLIAIVNFLIPGHYHCCISNNANFVTYDSKETYEALIVISHWLLRSSFCLLSLTYWNSVTIRTRNVPIKTYFMLLYLKSHQSSLNCRSRF